MSISTQIPCTIRDFTSDDSNIIQEIAHENFDKILELGHYSPENRDFMKKRWDLESINQIAKEQEEGKRVILVAEVDSQVVGMAGLVDCDVRMVLIKPSMSCKGIGTSLIQRIEQIAKDKGLSELTLSSFAHAVKFYEKLNFEPTSEPLKTEKGTEVTMRKRLA